MAEAPPSTLVLRLEVNVNRQSPHDGRRMASGVEVAGLVLAVLPLVVEGAKAYRKGLKTIVSLSSNTARDKALHWDYNKLWFQLFILNKRLQNIVLELPDLCVGCKTRLKRPHGIAEWEGNEAVQKSLQTYLGGEEDNLQAFLLVMSNILVLIDSLVTEPGMQLQDSQQVSGS